MSKAAYLKKLGARVAELRKGQNLNQSELARLAEKDRQSIHRLENGLMNPTAYYLKEIAAALRVPTRSLLDFE